MGSTIKPRRCAAPGKFCLWLETTTGGEVRLPGDHEELEAARAALMAVLADPEWKTGGKRIVVYDDQGQVQINADRSPEDPEPQ